MRERGIKKRTAFLLTLLLALSSAACGGLGGDTVPEAGPEPLLYLSFDEGSGTVAADASEHQTAVEVKYQYSKAAYTPAMEPQWRETGVEGGCLLFDGCSTYLEYPAKDLSVSGPALSVSVWVAPRAFEWDDPNAQAAGTEQLTAIVGQYNKDRKQGFILGYQRFGQLCFEVGAGEDWYTVWGEARLEKDAWNYVTAVFDGAAGKITLSLNGEAVGTAEVPAGSELTPAPREKLLVGKNAHATSIAAGTYCMFSGLMDELRLYDAVLTDTAPTVTPPAIDYADIALENILTEDVYKTQYHGGPYQHWMNEPHAPLYYNGMYHLFFQQNIVGTYWRNICWGHLVSEDTVSWRPVKEAITPTEDSVVPDGVWSGNAVTDKNGVPLLFFTAGNDSFQSVSGLISNQNIGVAWPADLDDPELTDWVIGSELALIQRPGQGRAGEFRDPYLWREGEKWYMLVCSGSTENAGGAALLYETDTLELYPGENRVAMDWIYRGSVYEWKNPSILYGTSWELPILLPLSNAAGQTKYFFAISPAPAGIADNKIYYFLGDFDPETGKFIPDSAFDGAPALLDYGDNVFTGPSALRDPVSGETVLFSIMQDKRSGAEEGAAGWAHCVGLPRVLRLNESGDDVCLLPSENLRLLEREILLSEENLSLEEANSALAGVSGDLLRLRVILEPAADTGSFGIQVKTNGADQWTRFRYDPETETVSGNTATRGGTGSPADAGGALSLIDGCLSMEIYIDRSLVEAYFNDTKAISVRSYGDPEAQSIELFAEDGLRVRELSVSAMGSIYS